MRIASLLGLILFLSLFSFAEKIAVFTEPIDPAQLAIAGDQLYVADFPYIYIYSTKDYTLKKKIGEAGEGPQQFHFSMGTLVNKTDSFRLNVSSDQLVVSSQNKVSFYAKDGTYLKEMKTGHPHDHKFSPLGDNRFMALTARRETDNLLYLKANIHNAGLEPVKEIFRYVRFSQPPAGDLNVIYDQGIMVQVFDKKIFATASGREDSVIDVFDTQGNKLYTVSYEYDRVPVSDTDKQNYLDFYKAGPLKYSWDIMKDQIKFPTKFPGLRNFLVADGKIYVQTYKKNKESSEFLIFDLKGKFLKKALVPVVEKDIYCYPYAISQGKLYQLVENEEKEHWELHAFSVD